MVEKEGRWKLESLNFRNAMKRIVCILFLLGGCLSLYAQTNQKVKISYQKMGDGLYDFYAENPNFYPVQLELKFTEFENMQANCDLPYVSTIGHGKQLLFNLKRTFIDLPGAFKYTYTTRIGAYPVHPDENVVYQLPVEKEKQTTIIDFDFTNSQTPNKIIWGFEMNEGDIVCACRGGIVCQITEVQMRDSIAVGDNTVTILHPDLTFGKYELLAEHSISVELGDTVKADDPIAKVGKNKFTKVPHVRFSVYYVNACIDSINENRLRNIYSYIEPFFTANEGERFHLVADENYTK